MTIVVLPFVNRSPDPGNDWFRDGLTAEIITDLSRIPALRVISRNSSMALKGAAASTASLKDRLGVSHVVTGSVRRTGDALRITAGLVDAASDRPLWSEKYAGSMDDVFGIQEEIAGKIVAALEVTLTEGSPRPAAVRQIDNVVAYDCYLRARREMYSWTPDSWRRAHQLIDEALGIVGENALFLATKGQFYWNEVNIGLVAAEVGLPRAAEYAERALAIGPDHPVGVFLSGLIPALRGRPEEALPTLRRANELWPGDANLIGELCRFSITASVPNVEPLADHLIAIDPLTPVSRLVVTILTCSTGRHEQVGPAARRAATLAPDDSALNIYAAWHLAEAGHREEASNLLGRTAAAMGGIGGEWALVLKSTLDGGFGQALERFTPEVERGLQSETSARFMADVHALMGRRDAALRWLRLAIARGFINHPWLAVHDTFLESLRPDPAFQALMAELEPRWQALVEAVSRQ